MSRPASQPRATALLLLLPLALACASAMRKPRPVSELGTAAAPAGRSAQELVADGWASFARRPDVEAVKRAESLFLAAAEADPAGVEGLYGAIQSKVWLVDHVPANRAALAASAVDTGQACLRRAPESALCDYGLALALGLQAREVHGTAVEGLKLMVKHLERAAAKDPALDHAGPDRVLAEVLARAPAWPLGPGDPDRAVEVARHAVQLAPEYPPNHLALAEALRVTGSAAAARAAAEQAVQLARARPGDPDAAEWIRDGEALVERAKDEPPAS